MTPQSPTTQQELDLAEKIVKWLLSLAAVAGVGAGFVKWLRKRRTEKDAEYAARIDKIVRSQFAKEIASVDTACASLEEMRRYVLANTTALGDLQRETVRAMQTGDELLDQILTLVRDNRDWLNDLQSFTDHAHGIDRRSSVGAERRTRIEESFDAITERRHLRRRASDRLLEDFNETREREQNLKSDDTHGEVT